MPTYCYQCEKGHLFDRYLPLAEYDVPQRCDCGSGSRQLLLAPQIMVRKDIHYDSPIDGRPITNARARANDLARSNCIPYDPGMKQDAARRRDEADAALERNIDNTVEAEIGKMSSEKREKLQRELDGGMGIESVRTSPNVKPLKVDISHA